MSTRPSDPDLIPIPSDRSRSDRLVESLESHGFFRGPISPEKHSEIHALVQEFLDEAERDIQIQEQAARPRRASRTTKIFAALLVTACAFVWVVQPTAPERERYDPPRVVQDASLRLAMVLRRSRVEDYRRIYGRLPARMSSEDSIIYRRLSNTEYELRGVNGPIRAVLRSSDLNASFLGSSLETLSRRRRSRQ